MAIAANIKRLLDSSSETMENNVNRRRNFCEIVQRHIEGTQLIDLENCIFCSRKLSRYIYFRFVRDFAEIYRFYILWCFSWCLATISLTLLVVKMEMVEYHWLDISRNWILMK